jgi:hypothetical protein
MRNRLFCEKLRRLADLYERIGDFPQPSILTLFLNDEQLSDYLRDIGSFKKEYSDSYCYIKPVGLEGVFEILVNRSAVCERVVVGEEEIPERTIPAHKKEIVEWKCRPMLAEAVPATVEILHQEIDAPAIPALAGAVAVDDIPF